MMRREPSDGGPARLAAATRLARLGGQIALEHWTRAEVSWKSDDSMVTDADLAIDPDGHQGEPIALLAGDPLAHDQALRDLLALG